MTLGPTVELAPFPAPAEPARRRSFAPAALRAVGVLLVCGVAYALFLGGLRLRHYVFEQTVNIRFVNDARNAMNWGNEVNNEGLFQIYDNDAVGLTPRNLKKLDYPPLRLAIAGRWMAWTKSHFPGPQRPWSAGDYAYIEPMLKLNTVAELISSVFVFMLIRMWRIRWDDANRLPTAAPRAFRGVIPGLIGAAIFWLNPGVLWVSHAWPQWDVWLTPFFLAAVLLACVDAWFAAGMCIAIGACLKGQILLALPTLLLWPIFRMKLDAVLMLIAGVVFTFAAVLFNWLHPSHTAIAWLILFITGAAATVPFVLRLKLKPMWLAACAIAAIPLALPWTSSASWSLRLVPVAMLGALLTSHWLPRRLVPGVYALVIGICVFMTIPLYAASRSWYDVGFEFGTRKFMIVANDGTDNLPGILQETGVLGLSNEGNPNVPVDVPLVGPITFRNLMLSIFALCLLISGIGAAIHSKRNDPRFLVAMVVPWVCMFALLTQLNNRYLIWAAGFSALLAGVGVGMSVLGLILSVISCMGMAQIMYTYNGAYARNFPDTQQMKQYMDTLNPNLGWLVLVIAAVYLYVAVTPSRSTRWA
jgi:hypothetical protein